MKKKKRKEKDLNSKQDEGFDSEEENYTRRLEATRAVQTAFSPTSYFTHGPLKAAIPVNQQLKRFC